MEKTEKTRFWNGHTLYLQDTQGIWVSNWQDFPLAKGKKSNPNDYIEALQRVVEVPTQNTGKEYISSNDGINNQTYSTHKALNHNKTVEKTQLSESGSQDTMGIPEVTMTPQNDIISSNGLINLPSLQKVRSDEQRFTIALDTEYYYEKPENGLDEHGKRNVTSYQFAFYLDETHVMEVVFLIKPISDKNGKKIYKRPTLSLCLGTMLDLCTIYQDKAYEYRNTRRYPVAIRNEDGKKICKDKLYKSPEEAFNAVGSLQEKYSNCLIDTSNVEADTYKNVYSDFMGERAIKITILCHSGLADLSTFTPERNFKHKRKNSSLLWRLTSLQGGLVSMEDIHFRAVHKDYWKFYSCMVQFRDTMCFADPKSKKLEILGEAVGIPKVKLPDGAIKHMGEYLSKNKSDYLEYAASDALIALVFASRMFLQNRAMPLTVSAAAADTAYQSICSYMGITNEADYRLYYAGLAKVIKGKQPNHDRPGYMEVSNMEPYNHRAFLLLNTAANSYKGGFNSCSRVGWFNDETFWDFDLKNAYPTSCCCIYDIDFQKDTDPLDCEPICQRELTLADFDTPYDPLVAYVKFEFPSDCKYPCFPISHEGSLVFPLSTEGLEGAYACGPDIYLALQLGAKVYCIDGYRGRIRKRKDGAPSQSLREAVFQLVKDRTTAKILYGDGIEEQILKVMVNSIYGKIAQCIVSKRTWDGMDENYVDLGPSKITNPIHAAPITAGVRSCLIAAMTQLEELGYKVYSVTTDGFISNAPKEILDSLDLFGFASYFKEARLFLTEGKNDAMWEAKHTMNRFLNASTRANVSPDDGGVCAHGNLVTGFEHDSVEDRQDYIQKVLKRTGKIPSLHTEFINLKDMLTKDMDFYTYDKVTNLSFDFDLKRKPVESSFNSVYVNVDNGNYDCVNKPTDGYFEIACFETVPYANMAEYELYRSAGAGCTVLRTAADWEKFFVRVKCPQTGKNRITNLEWTKLVSCIIGYRQGILKIAPLDDCPDVSSKIEYINRHNKSGRTFKESDWKNCRRPERASQMLPVETIQAVLDDLRSGS